jgi:hypothetical protein
MIEPFKIVKDEDLTHQQAELFSQAKIIAEKLFNTYEFESITAFNDSIRKNNGVDQVLALSFFNKITSMFMAGALCRLKEVIDHVDDHEVTLQNITNYHILSMEQLLKLQDKTKTKEPPAEIKKLNY